MSQFTDEQVAALADAMWQLLNDMGKTGKTVCGLAKASARLAYEPWFQAEKISEELHDGDPMYADWMTGVRLMTILHDIVIGIISFPFGYQHAGLNGLIPAAALAYLTRYGSGSSA